MSIKTRKDVYKITKHFGHTGWIKPYYWFNIDRDDVVKMNFDAFEREWGTYYWPTEKPHTAVISFGRMSVDQIVPYKNPKVRAYVTELVKRHPDIGDYLKENAAQMLAFCIADMSSEDKYGNVCITSDDPNWNLVARLCDVFAA